MKKTTKKLTLNTTTVRLLQQTLDNTQLLQVAGGQRDPTEGCGASRNAVC